MTPNRTLKSTFKLIAANLLFALVYFAVSYLAYHYMVRPNIAIWPATGMGIGAVIIWKKRVLPGLILAEILISVAIYGSHKTLGLNEATFYNLLFLFANVFRPILAGFLVLNVLKGQLALVKKSDIFTFFSYAALLPLLLTTLLFSILLYQIGYYTSDYFITNTVLWYLGDVMSVLIFTPALLTLFSHPKALWRPRIISLTLPILISFILISLLFNSFHQFETLRINNDIENRLNFLSNILAHATNDEQLLMQQLSQQASKQEDLIIDLAIQVNNDYQNIYRNSNTPVSRFNEFIHTTDIKIEDQNYRLTIAPANDHFISHAPWNLWLMLTIAMFFSGFIAVVMLILTGRNYTAARRVIERTRDLNLSNLKLAQKNLDYKRIIESHPVIFWKVNIQQDQIKFVSSEAESLLGYPLKQWLTEPHFLMNKIHPNDLSAFKTALFQDVFKTQNLEIDYRIKHANGSYRWFRDTLYLPEDFDQTHEIMGMMVDIHDKKSSAQKIHHLAFHDHLTQLPNRQQLQSVLQELIKGGEQQELFGAVIFLDMDRFKVLNDALGHHFGDLLLLKISNRLKLYQDEFKLIARFGGDEFVLVTDCEYQTANDAAVQIIMLAEDIIQTLAKPYQISHHHHICTVSMGVAIYPNQGNTVNDIIRQADVAMYRSKEQGRNQVTMYHPSMKQHNDQILFVEQVLRKAVNEDAFILKYQPIVNKDRTIVSFEALIRIFQDGRIIYPDEFIPVAEDTDLIQAVGRWVISNACFVANECGHNISINVSSKQFHQQGFIKYIEQIINRFEIKPNSLTIELTEGVVVGNFNELQYKFNRLKELGVKIAIDDFGTGYSSLQYLRQLPIDYLKIDKSFIEDIQTDESAEVIIKTITAMAGNLKMKTIAEGIENEVQFTMLKNLGCDYFQGFLFGRPGDLRTIQDS